MPNISTNSPDGSPSQKMALFRGKRAAGTTAIKTYASLANNQTLTLLENVAGVPTLVTFEVEKVASGWTPTGGAVVVIDITAATDSATAWAAIVAFLNARPNAAYVFTASASGYTFVAKQAGSQWNGLATGTAVNTSGTNAITTTGLDARSAAPNAIRWLDGVARGVIPPFVAGAASIAPGTDGASGYVLDSYVTLTAPAALTLASTGTPVVGNKLILCMSLALGQTLSIVNGPLANTIASFPAALTRPRGAVINWDGFNFSLVGYIEGEI